MLKSFAELFPSQVLWTFVYRALADGVSLLSEARWGLLSCAPEAGAQPNRGEFPSGPGDVQIDGSALGCAPAPGARERASVFWHAQSPSNSLLLTWENALVGRDPDCPTNLQAELYADGRFAWRTDDASRLYLPVLDFDWDGDGLENSVDPDPLVAGPDAHGTNAEWYRVVCSNVFAAVDILSGSESNNPDNSNNQTILPEGVAFRANVNAGAGSLYPITDGNYWMTDEAGRDRVCDNWSSGRLVWKIPIGWQRLQFDGDDFTHMENPDFEQWGNSSSRPLLIGGSEDSYLQVFEIDENGTASVEKFGYRLSRARTSFQGVVTKQQ